MANQTQLGTMQLLNPVTLPLKQNALIEASAGTGKTYTITSLYLRALLGLTEQEKPLNPLSIEQILVVTFTEAATQEIKSRVRDKLRQTQDVLMTGECDDSLLNQILDDYVQAKLAEQSELTEQDAKLLAYHRLQDAITLIDEASIFTIHGFCHRCLKQFAFETNSSFEQSFEMDAKPTLLIALQDFWRRHIVGLKQAEFSWFEKIWRDPDQLFADLKQVLLRQVDISPNVSTADYETLIKKYQELTLELKQRWLSENFAAELTAGGVNKKKKQYTRLPLINEWATSQEWLPPLAGGDSWHLWSSESLSDSKNFTAKAQPFVHTLTSLIDELAELNDELTGRFKAHWLNQAKHYVEQRAGQLKTEQGIINPDDLLQELLLAIDSDQELRLIKAIQTKYPLAFIDEFQDTDPVQYGIFSAIYNQASIEESRDDETEVNANMILIGDPKQAIYKFRGADIYTYIQAKTDIPQSQHYTLATNWRSHPNLIKAVNHCFKQNDDVFRHQQIPFIDVGAGRSASKQLIEDKTSSSNLEFWHLMPDSVDAADSKSKPQLGFIKTEADKLMAKWVASDIKARINKTESAEFVLQNKDVVTKLNANDFCVLVRNRNQARMVKQALSQQGIASVFISRDNVFKTEVGKDLLRLLHAVAAPFNEHKVRAATASLFFDYSVSELTTLMLQGSDEQHDWQQHLDWFYQAHEMWQNGKAARAINFLLEHAQTLVKWQADQALDSDRLITDLRHLVELIQMESVKHAGAHKLLLWFEQQVNATDQWSDASDEQQLRLESDSNLVQIATLHASKGLEYPIVYLPFISEFTASKSAIYHSKERGLSYRVDNRKLELQIAEEERLAEDLRLLYVAMTRPVFKLIVGVVNLLEARGRVQSPAFEKTALGQLLLGHELQDGTTISNELITNQCQKLEYETNALTSQTSVEYKLMQQSNLLDAFASFKAQAVLNNKPVSTLTFEQFDTKVADHWKMLSYSALAMHHHHNTEEWLPGVSDEQGFAEQNDLDPTQEPRKTPFTFPKGANAGSCLHWILENLDFQLSVVEQQEVIEQGLERYGIDISWVDTVVPWMQKVLNASLTDFNLKQVLPQHRLVEMEFYFDFAALNPKVLNQALLMAGVEQIQASDLILGDNASLQGVLKGFIDLTIFASDKYYVLDYKSNYLGDDTGDYQSQNLANAMSEHSYQLQALIYTLALHRWLQQRLTDYDYETHIGGSLYLFLRGMVAESDDKSGVYHLSFKQDVIEFLDNALRKVPREAIDNDAELAQDEIKENVNDDSNDQQNEQMGFEF